MAAMIPTIGLMIGVYTTTRLVSLITRSGERGEHWLVIGLSILALAVTLFCLAGLFMSAVELDPNFK